MAIFNICNFNLDSRFESKKKITINSKVQIKMDKS